MQVPDSGSKFIVNLRQKTYTCTNFFEYLGPCTYAITACRFEAEDPYVYFNWAYRIMSYRKTYYNPMMPVSIEDLPSHPNVRACGISLRTAAEKSQLSTLITPQ
jgi:hypothetical protein